MRRTRQVSGVDGRGRLVRPVELALLPGGGQVTDHTAGDGGVLLALHTAGGAHEFAGTPGAVGQLDGRLQVDPALPPARAVADLVAVLAIRIAGVHAVPDDRGQLASVRTGVDRELLGLGLVAVALRPPPDVRAVDDGADLDEQVAAVHAPPIHQVVEVEATQAQRAIGELLVGRFGE